MEDNKNITIMMIAIIVILLVGLALILRITRKNTNQVINTVIMIF